MGGVHGTGTAGSAVPIPRHAPGPARVTGPQGLVNGYRSPEWVAIFGPFRTTVTARPPARPRGPRDVGNVSGPSPSPKLPSRPLRARSEDRT
jgi:hypothetical protein